MAYCIRFLHVYGYLYVVKKRESVPFGLTGACWWGMSKHLHNKLGQWASILANNRRQQTVAMEDQQMELGHQVCVFIHTAQLEHIQHTIGSHITIHPCITHSAHHRYSHHLTYAHLSPIQYITVSYITLYTPTYHTSSTPQVVISPYSHLSHTQHTTSSHHLAYTPITHPALVSLYTYQPITHPVLMYTSSIWQRYLTWHTPDLPLTHPAYYRASIHYEVVGGRYGERETHTNRKTDKWGGLGGKSAGILLDNVTRVTWLTLPSQWHRNCLGLTSSPTTRLVRRWEQSAVTPFCCNSCSLCVVSTSWNSEQQHLLQQLQSVCNLHTLTQPHLLKWLVFL